MELKNFVARVADGEIVPGATYYVYIADTMTLATIYNKDGVAIANPGTASASGQIAFAAADGDYDLRVTDGLTLDNQIRVTFADVYRMADLANDSDPTKGASLVGRVVETFDTVADMAAANLVIGKAYRTLGYYSAGDGGAADYIGTAIPYVPIPSVDHASSNGVVAVLCIGQQVLAAQAGCTPAMPSVTGVNELSELPCDIVFERGVYAITQPIRLSRASISGRGMIDTVIRPAAGVAKAFEFQEDGFPNGGSLRGFRVEFTGGPVGSYEPGTYGIYINRASGAFFFGSMKFSELWIQGAEFGVYDFGGAFLHEYERIIAFQCKDAFSKFGGTTTKFTQCYSYSSVRGFRADICVNIELNMCAVDGVATTTVDNCAAYITNCNQVCISGGWDSEAISVTGDNALIVVSGCSIVDIRGLTFVTSTIGGTSGPGTICSVILLQHVASATVSIDASGITVDPASNEAATVVRCVNSNCDINSSVLRFAGKKANSLSIHQTGSKVTYSGAPTLMGVSGRVSVPGVTEYNASGLSLSVPANSRTLVGDYAAANSSFGDVFACSTSPNTARVFPVANTSAAGAVSVYLVNPTGTSESFSGTIYYTRPATVLDYIQP